MTAALLLSVAVSWAIGWSVVSLLWRIEDSASDTQRFLRICLAFGLGQGITSCLAFLYLIAYGRASASYYLFEVPLAACVLAFCFFRRRKHAPVAPAPASAPEDRWFARSESLLGLAFYTTAATALTTIALRLWHSPHGGYDAWAIWNERARALFRGGEAWRDSFTNIALGHPHPDYPLLLPLSVMRAWMYGGETTLAPALLAWLFFGATIGLVTAGVSKLCGRMHGYLAGTALLTHLYFVLHAASQMAEGPLMFFYAAALASIALHNEDTGRRAGGMLALAGLAAGLAAWTKNDGALFLVALLCAHFAVTAYTVGFETYSRQARAFAAGLIPVLAVILYFKTQFAPPNIWVAEMSAPQAAVQVTDPGRLWLVAKQFARSFLVYSGPGVNIVYLLLLVLVCFGIARRHLTTVAQGALTLAIMMSGFIVIYLVRNANVAAFMAGSIDRVLVQMWPAFVFAFFLLAAPLEPRASRATRAPAP